MDLRTAYRQAEAPSVRRCIGLELEAYSAGHERLLSILKNSFIENPDASDYQDLISGVFICSQPWRDAESNLRSRLRNCFLTLWGWRAGRFDVPGEMLKFKAYLAVSRADPRDDYKIKIDPFKPLSPTPDLHILKLFLIQELRLTEAEFWDRPLILSRADYWAILESKALVEIMTEKDREYFRAAKN